MLKVLDGLEISILRNLSRGLNIGLLDLLIVGLLIISLLIDLIINL